MTVGVGWNTESALVNRVGQRPYLSGSKGMIRNNGQEQGWGDKPTTRGAELAPSRVRWNTKSESGNGVKNQPPRVGLVVDSRAGLLGLKAELKTEVPHLAGGGADQTRVAAIEQHSCHLVKTTADWTILNKLVVSYFRSQLQPTLWIEGTKYCSKISNLIRPCQSSCL
jgi:hypothetical protein